MQTPQGLDAQHGGELCLACGQGHVVNPKTGKLGVHDE
jgi:hypothetical protein